jgi:hypothetical protein
MADPTRPTTMLKAVSLALVMMTSLTPQLVVAAGKSDAKAVEKDGPPTAPALWGYGMKSCSAFLASAPGGDASAEVAGPDYLRYREWLSGLVSGLNLATGRDVLRGAEIDAALVRIQASCQDRPKDDFFNASLRLVRSLGQLDAK